MSKSVAIRAITVLTLTFLLAAARPPLASGTELNKQRIDLLIGGGSATGFSTRLAEGCAEAIRRALPNWSVTATAGAIASNIKFVHEGEMQLTVAYPELIAEANKGVGTYKTQMPDIKMIANLTSWPTQIILLDKIPISSIQEKSCKT